MKYIYFEIHTIYTEEDKWIPASRQIKNVNELLLPPEDLSSSGYKGFRTVTERNTEITSNLFLDQIWVDLDVYKIGDKIPTLRKEDISNAIELLVMMKEQTKLTKREVIEKRSKEIGEERLAKAIRKINKDE